MFHFTFATGWEAEQLWQRLMLDSVEQLGGSAASNLLSQEILGGNPALLDLYSIQVVQAEVFVTNDVHVHAGNGFTSFTDVLLYEY